MTDDLKPPVTSTPVGLIGVSDKDASGYDHKAEAGVLTGQIVTAHFEDGRDNYDCGLEECECPDHEGGPEKPGTYITIRLDADAPVGLWPVEVRMMREARS